MKIAIMQPYLFPYLGYFQLIAKVDKFIFYDDVFFIKNGWINRNRLIISGQQKYFTIPLLNGSSNTLIKDVLIGSNANLEIKKILKSIEYSYCKSPFYCEIFPIIERVLKTDSNSISTIAKLSILVVLKYLDVECEFTESSVKYPNTDLKSVDRILNICELEKADEYINLPGGKSLYDEKLFRKKGIKLTFIEPNLLPYAQTIKDFIPGLSIIDIVMNNDSKSAKVMLGI